MTMGDNAEIFERLRCVETQLATLNERLKWHEKLFVVAFGGGGVVGAAITLIVMHIMK